MTKLCAIKNTWKKLPVKSRKKYMYTAVYEEQSTEIQVGKRMV